MPGKGSKRNPSKRASPRQLPYCFVSYSTREPHVQILIDCLKIVLGSHFEVRLTPSVLESGASQHQQILQLIEGSSFAVVILDGLRPNVVYELGLIVGSKKPVLLFKELNSVVDIQGLYNPEPPEGLDVDRPAINLDTQMSDIKDMNYATWVRYDLKTTLKSVWQEYNKKRNKVTKFPLIEEPTLCE